VRVARFLHSKIEQFLLRLRDGKIRYRKNVFMENVVFSTLSRALETTFKIKISEFHLLFVDYASLKVTQFLV
jgi:hypothetical protein